MGPGCCPGVERPTIRARIIRIGFGGVIIRDPKGILVVVICTSTARMDSRV